jgi:molybdopterin converting factor small subunit
VGDLPALAPRRASLAVAVNRAYEGFAAVLQDGDEVAFIPPVSGR